MQQKVFIKMLFLFNTEIIKYILPQWMLIFSILMTKGFMTRLFLFDKQKK